MDSSPKISLAYAGACTYKDEFYFSCTLFNGLMKYNMKTGDVKNVLTFPGETLEREHLHRNALLYNNRIIFLPDRAKAIHMFSPDTEEIETISLPVNTEKVYRCAGSVRYNNLVFIWGMHIDNPLIIFNLDTKDITRVDDVYSVLPDSIKAMTTPVFREYFAKDKDVFLPVYGTEYVLKYNFESGNREVISLAPYVKHILTVTVADEKYYCTEIGSWDVRVIGENGCEVYTVKDGDAKSHIKHRVLSIIPVGKRVIVVANSTEYIYIIDNASRMIEKYAAYPVNLERIEYKTISPHGIFGYPTIEDNRIFLPPVGVNMAVLIDVSLGTVSTLEIESDKEKLYNERLALKYSDFGEQILLENRGLTLDDFIKLVQISEKKADRECPNYGKQIWEKICQ